MGICLSEESILCKEEEERSMANDISDELNRVAAEYTEDVEEPTPATLTHLTEKLFFYRKQYYI